LTATFQTGSQPELNIAQHFAVIQHDLNRAWNANCSAVFSGINTDTNDVFFVQIDFGMICWNTGDTGNSGLSCGSWNWNCGFIAINLHQICSAGSASANTGNTFGTLCVSTGEWF
jgi:hypothetical protein